MNPEENSPLKQIRTFQGDVAEALKNQGESVMSIRRAELTKQGGGNEFAPQPTPQEELEKKSREKIILLIVGTFILIALGGVGMWYAYSGYKEKTALPTVIVIPNKFISTETSSEINVSGLARETFFSAFNLEKNTEVKNATLKQVQLIKDYATTTRLIKTTEFFDILNTKAPSSLIRALNPMFMFGVIGDTSDASSTPHTFIIFKSDSFENTYAGMLGWEKNMSEDLLPLFVSEDISLNFPSDTPFIDSTIQNKDARTLKDTSGKTVMLYSFFDNNILIITDNESSLRTLVIKLNADKLSR